MIIILTENECHHRLFSGDTFSLIIDKIDGTEEKIISEEIITEMTIDYAITFVFAEDNGIVLNRNLSGMFGIKDNLPIELREAKRLNDLTSDQLMNLISTCPMKLSFK